MPKRKEPELDPKEQWKRFKEAANEKNVDFAKAEVAFESVVQKRRQKIQKENDGE